MKILKPGKVEMRKFVCEKCGCIFVANPADECYEYPEHVKCPQDGCDWYVLEHIGEPYEEPVQKRTYVGMDQYSERSQNSISTEQSRLSAINGVTFREGQ